MKINKISIYRNVPHQNGRVLYTGSVINAMRQYNASAQASQRMEGERRLKENCVAPNARITTMDLVVQQPEIIDQ